MAVVSVVASFFLVCVIGYGGGYSDGGCSECGSYSRSVECWWW